VTPTLVTPLDGIVNRKKRRPREGRDAATVTNSFDNYSEIASESPDNRLDSVSTGTMSTGTYLNQYELHVYTQLDGTTDSVNA